MRKKDKKKKRKERPPWIVDLILFLASTAYSYAAQKKARRAVEDAQFRDDKPTTLARRGTHCDYIIGVRRCGTVLAWADFEQRVVPGGASHKHEPGLSVFCVGPVTAVYSFEENSDIIVSFGLNGQGEESFDFDSGLPAAPLFTDTRGNGREILELYWGWGDQPRSASLAEPQNFNISSSFPFFCYGVWDRKRLPIGQIWPIVNFEFRVDPFQAPENPRQLFRTSPYRKSDVAVDSTITPLPLLLVITSFGQTLVRVQGDASEFSDGDIIGISGGPASGSWILSQVDPYNSASNYTNMLIHPSEVAPADPSGSGAVVSVFLRGDDGANPAHALLQMLGSPYPWGMGKGFDRYHLESFEVLGELFEAEKTCCNIRLSEGEYFERAIEGLQQDFNILFFTDDDGLERVRAIRSTDPVTIIPREHVTGSEPEVVTSHWRGPSTSFSYSFTDRARNYEIETYPLDDDGFAVETGAVKPETIQIDSVTSLRVARPVAERRQQEIALGRGSLVRFQLLRESKRLRAGDAFLIEGEDAVMRVESIQPQRGRERVWLRAYRDPFATPIPVGESLTYIPPPTIIEPRAPLGESVNGFSLETNFAGGFLAPGVDDGRVEVIASVTRFEGSTATRWIMHVEDEYGVPEASGSFTEFAALGTLTTAVLSSALAGDAPDSDDATVTATGALVDWLGLPDFREDSLSWTQGRLLAFVGTELMSLAGVVESSGAWSLRGLRRLKPGSSGVSWPSGTVVRVFCRDNAFVERRVNERMRWRGQAANRHGSARLSTVSARSVDPSGVSRVGAQQVP